MSKKVVNMAIVLAVTAVVVAVLYVVGGKVVQFFISMHGG